MALHIGFTGTAKGMTAQQTDRVQRILMRLKARYKRVVLHHGDCIGADSEAHAIARLLRIPVVIHPPLDPRKQAFCQNAWKILEPKAYLARDWDIAHDTAGLIGAVLGLEEEYYRTGEWATIRYARKQYRKIKIVFPDGKIRSED